MAPAPGLMVVGRRPSRAYGGPRSSPPSTVREAHSSSTSGTHRAPRPHPPLLGGGRACLGWRGQRSAARHQLVEIVGRLALARRLKLSPSALRGLRQLRRRQRGHHGRIELLTDRRRPRQERIPSTRSGRPAPADAPSPSCSQPPPPGGRDGEGVWWMLRDVSWWPPVREAAGSSSRWRPRRPGRCAEHWPRRRRRRRSAATSAAQLQ